MIVAETVRIDGGLLFAILAVVALVVAAGIAWVVAGFVWAYRAGRGSTHSAVGFALVAATEIAFVVPAVADDPGAVVLALPLVAQVALFFHGRRKGPAPPPADAVHD